MGFKEKLHTILFEDMEGDVDCPQCGSPAVLLLNYHCSDPDCDLYDPRVTIKKGSDFEKSNLMAFVSYSYQATAGRYQAFGPKEAKRDLELYVLLYGKPSQIEQTTFGDDDTSMPGQLGRDIRKFLSDGYSKNNGKVDLYKVRGDFDFSGSKNPVGYREIKIFMFPRRRWVLW